MPTHFATSDAYDSEADFRASVEWAYEHIRERVAKGGKGWRGYMNGTPLVETPPPTQADRFRVMADRIERNSSEFGGACVIVPPGQTDPIEFLVVDPKGDLAQFFSTIQTKIQVMLEEMKDKQRQLQGWR